MNDNGKPEGWEHLREQSDLVPPDKMAILHLIRMAFSTINIHSVSLKEKENRVRICHYFYTQLNESSTSFQVRKLRVSFFFSVSCPRLPGLGYFYFKTSLKLNTSHSPMNFPLSNKHIVWTNNFTLSTQKLILLW